MGHEKGSVERVTPVKVFLAVGFCPDKNLPTTTEPIAGLEDVMELLTTLVRLFAGKRSQLVRSGLINGLPGFISIDQDNFLQTTVLEIENDKVIAISATRNPDKLRRLSGEVIQ